MVTGNADTGKLAGDPVHGDINQGKAPDCSMKHGTGIGIKAGDPVQ